MIFYYQQFVINFKIFKQPLCMADNKILTRSFLNDLSSYNQKFYLNL